MSIESFARLRKMLVEIGRGYVVPDLAELSGVLHRRCRARASARRAPVPQTEVWKRGRLGEVSHLVSRDIQVLDVAEQHLASPLIAVLDDSLDAGSLTQAQRCRHERARRKWYEYSGAPLKCRGHTFSISCAAARTFLEACDHRGCPS